LECPVCQDSQQQPFGDKDGYSLYQCQGCEFVHVFPIPSDDELSAFYEDYHKTHQYASKAASKTRRARKRIQRLQSLTAGRRFVDIGCNAGFAVEAARSLGWQALGIDIDSIAIEEARRLFDDASFEAISVQSLAQKGEKFDLIYCSEVIEHLPELDSFLESVSGLMHEQSLLYLTTPDLGHFKLRFPFRGEPLLSWDAVRPPEHLFYFQKNNLSDLLTRTGFSQIRYQFSLQPTIKAVVRL